MKEKLPGRPSAVAATNMPFSPDEIEIKEFVPTLRGYGREEVRAYLRSVSEDVRRLEDQLEAAKSSAPSLPAKPLPVAQRVEQQDDLSTEPWGPAVEPPANTFAPLGLATADLRLVADLREALSELTQAIAQLSTQGLPVQLVTVPESTPAPLDRQTFQQQPPPISVPAKLEKPFVHVKPPPVANSGIGKRDQVHWDGIDRRGPERPWNSTPVEQSTSTTVRATSLRVDDPQIVAHRLDAGSFSPSGFNPVSIQEGNEALPVDRELRNRSLIGTYLDGALGRNRTHDRDAHCEIDRTAVEPRIPKARVDQEADSPDSGQILRSPTSDTDNVVVFKRAAS
jgi:DivIVA domain-containing protein